MQVTMVTLPVEEVGVYKPSKEGFAEVIEFEVVS